MKAYEMYLAPMDDIYFGYYVTRMLWKPWRYTLWAQPTTKPAQIIATNFTRDQAVGLLRFFGVLNLGD
jgi:hypothetical protein